MSVYHMRAWCRWRSEDSLELKLWTVWSCHETLVTELRFSQEHAVPLTSEPLLQPRLPLS